jgi:hypothetical protein
MCARGTSDDSCRAPNVYRICVGSWLVARRTKYRFALFLFALDACNQQQQAAEFIIRVII